MERSRHGSRGHVTDRAVTSRIGATSRVTNLGVRSRMGDSASGRCDDVPRELVLVMRKVLDPRP
eukprot:1202465-Rhodomonas_salina.3